jgi:GNAT superfamily N-acetyltransferase
MNASIPHDMTAIHLLFVPARMEDAPLLSATAFLSKSVWGYSTQQMQLWTEELTLSETYIKSHQVVKVYDDQTLIGFYSLVAGEEYWKLDHFWLLPEAIGKGYGKDIFAQLTAQVRTQGAQVLEVSAEPNAEGFYEKMGGQLLKKVNSKIEGRHLPVYQFKLH